MEDGTSSLEQMQCLRSPRCLLIVQLAIGRDTYKAHHPIHQALYPKYMNQNTKSTSQIPNTIMKYMKKRWQRNKIVGALNFQLYIFAIIMQGAGEF